jgi:hypothetical protein
MIPNWSKLLAVLLAVMFTGAAHACLCAGMGNGAAQATAETDPHACCKPDGEKVPATPASEDPCKNCNAQHRLTLTVPEKAGTAPALDFAFVTASTIDLPSLEARTEFRAYPGNDDVPIPPLLRDLFHSSCQLTV